MKKEHPILYSTAMVKAKLEGRKTQTRRIITPHNCVTSIQKKYLDWDHDNIFINGDLGIKLVNIIDGILWRASCKWQPGDLLWGRETWCYAQDYHDCGISCEYGCNCPTYGYGADWQDDEIKWKPSIHMPKAAARIWDEVVSVRSERLHEITEEDAIAEGIEYHCPKCGYTHVDAMIHGDHRLCGSPMPSAKEVYRQLWESINGIGSWEKNPLVWRIETKPYRK